MHKRRFAAAFTSPDIPAYGRKPFFQRFFITEAFLYTYQLVIQ